LNNVALTTKNMLHRNKEKCSIVYHGNTDGISKFG
jgi:hypothetical protein